MKSFLNRMITVLTHAKKRKNSFEETYLFVKGNGIEVATKLNFHGGHQYGFWVGKIYAIKNLLDDFFADKNKPKTAFIIDDLRASEYCLELNGIKDNPSVFLATNADKAIEAFEQLSLFGGKFDYICLDHDLGDGKDIIHVLNWIILQIHGDNHEVYKKMFDETEWHIHTSNYGAIPNIISKVRSIIRGFNIDGKIYIHGKCEMVLIGKL